MHNGVLLNIGKLVERIKVAEKSLLDTEQKLSTVQTENVTLTASSTKAQSKIKELAADLKSANRKLSDTESSLKSSQRKNSDYLSVLTTVHDKVTNVLPKREKDKSSGS